MTVQCRSKCFNASCWSQFQKSKFFNLYDAGIGQYLNIRCTVFTDFPLLGIYKRYNHIYAMYRATHRRNNKNMGCHSVANKFSYECDFIIRYEGRIFDVFQRKNAFGTWKFLTASLNTIDACQHSRTQHLPFQLRFSSCNRICMCWVRQMWIGHLITKDTIPALGIPMTHKENASGMSPKKPKFWQIDMAKSPSNLLRYFL